jgi:hypothetical protein
MGEGERNADDRRDVAAVLTLSARRPAAGLPAARAGDVHACGHDRSRATHDDTVSGAHAHGHGRSETDHSGDADAGERVPRAQWRARRASRGARSRVGCPLRCDGQVALPPERTWLGGGGVSPWPGDAGVGPVAASAAVPGGSPALLLVR